MALAFRSAIPHALILLYWYGLTISLAMFNYSTWVRFAADLIADDTMQTYLAFAIIGVLAYAFVGGPLFFMAYKYSSTAKVRAKRLRIGLAVMYFSSTLPLFLLDLYFIWSFGVVNVLQVICFILQLVAWIFGSFAVWFIYMWQVAKYIHIYRGGGRQVALRQQAERQGEPGIEGGEMAPPWEEYDPAFDEGAAMSPPRVEMQNKYAQRPSAARYPGLPDGAPAVI
jgi:hypothetical protein